MSKSLTACLNLPPCPCIDPVLPGDLLPSPAWATAHPFLLSTIEYPFYLTIHPNSPGGPPSSYLPHKGSGQRNHDNMIAFAYTSCLLDPKDSGEVELESGASLVSSFSCGWTTQQMYILHSPFGLGTGTAAKDKACFPLSKTSHLEKTNI